MRVMNYNNDFQNAVTFELSLHKKVISRRVRSLVDFFIELGGLFSAFSAGVTCLLFFVNYMSSYQFVMAELFAEKIA